jgi:hypothetical protein
MADLMASASNKETVVPVAASAAGPGKWRSAALVHGVVSIVGGFSMQPMTGSSIEYMDGGIMSTFVLLDKNAQWFLKGVGGPQVRKGDLKAVTVLQQIRDRFNEQPIEHDTTVAGASCTTIPDTAVAESICAAVADECGDPMDDLDDLPKSVAKPHVKAPRNKHTKKSEVRHFDMPMRPPCAAQGCTERVTLGVYRKPVAAHHKAGTLTRNNTMLYLKSDCINWLLSYAADELHHQGIAATLDDDPMSPQSRSGNCTDIENLQLEWDFSGRGWTAKFVGGTFKGVTKEFYNRQLSGPIWDMLKDKYPEIGSRENSSLHQKKQSAKLFVLAWCRAIVENTGDTFEAMWNLDDLAVLETPQKKPRLDTKLAAVAESSGLKGVAAAESSDSDE